MLACLGDNSTGTWHCSDLLFSLLSLEAESDTDSYGTKSRTLLQEPSQLGKVGEWEVGIRG